jgi:lysophospholipase L1-like esterase
MKLSPRSRLVMIGDSVTDCDRARPVGEGDPDALGHGYVAEIAALLMAVYPARSIRVTNMGISANTVRDLAARWDADVLALKPNWLSVMIGINDVWRHFDPVRQAEAVPPEEFARTYDGLLIRTRAQLKGLVLVTPYYIEPSSTDAMRQRMNEYGAIVKQLAMEHDAICVDTQAAFDRALAHHESAVFSADRVHPNRIGHMILARAFLNAVGFAWSAPDRRP